MDFISHEIGWVNVSLDSLVLISHSPIRSKIFQMKSLNEIIEWNC